MGGGFVIKAGESSLNRHLKMKGVTLNVLDLKVSSSDTHGNLAVFEQVGYTPMGGPPLHIHHSQDEMFYVLEGEYLFQVGKKRYDVKTGDVVFLPKKIPHAFMQLTEKARVIVAYQPAGQMEEFFKKTDSWISPPTKEEMIRTFEEHGMNVVGPPLKAGY